MYKLSVAWRERRENLHDWYVEFNHCYSCLTFHLILGLKLQPNHENPNVIEVKITGIKFEFQQNGSLISTQTVIGSKMHEGLVKWFTKSSDFLDAGQNIEPFFDNRDVVLSKPLPLIGLNLYHYETSGYADNKFIGIQLQTIDILKQYVKLLDDSEKYRYDINWNKILNCTST